MNGTEMTSIRLKADAERNEWVRVWAVDEHDCVLHTEPVCTVYVGKVGHRWFVEWIEGLEPPIQMVALLHHAEEEVE